MSEIIIIGNGPAGISAALYTARAGIKTTIIGRDNGALTKAEKVENYYGFKNPIVGNELIEAGIAQAKRIGAEIISDEVVGIGYEDKLTVKTKNGIYKADGVILATGSPRSTPKINGVTEYEGKGISYCAVCDAFFYKGKDVAVFGCCDYALAEAMELLPVAKSVTIVTGGKEPIDNIPKEITVITKEIAEFYGESGTLSGVRFADETTLPVSGIFVAVGVAGSSDLAKKLGAETNGTKIVVNENMETNIPGLFAAGDCTGGMLQIAKAVYEGAKSGTEAIKFIRALNKDLEKRGGNK